MTDKFKERKHIMGFLVNYLKGIIVGIGGIAPGLSGSVMLLILGLYEKIVNIIGGFFKNIKSNIIFLIPVGLGMGTGVILFSKIVDFMLENYEFHTRYLFLGLVLGTIPLFFKEVTKNGYAKKYFFVTLIVAAIGFYVFSINKTYFAPVENPNLLQSAWLGVAVAGSSIIPGVDSAVILSSLGLYELYVSSLADLNMSILIPAGVGLVVGIFGISFIMKLLINKFYTMTFSIVFGLFISIIPNVLNSSNKITSMPDMWIAIGLIVFGFLFSFYLGDIHGNNERIKKLLKIK